MKKIIFGILALAVSLSVAIAQDAPARPWWQDTTWYLLFVRSFYDSDGDGIGDLRGIIEKLDYLNDGDPTTTTDLGITGIWLMPIFEANSYHGYDAIDYRAVEQDYGTQADFLDLMEAAHQRGIKIIVDMVLNHTSSENPWFIASEAQDPEYNDWYVWRDKNPNYKGPWGATAWYKDGDRYYYAPFWSEMPDLNYQNKRVTYEMYDVAGFWLDEMGVDGFRLDAIRYVVEDEVNGKPILADAPVNRQWLADYNAYVKGINPDAVTIGEIWTDSFTVNKYLEEGSVDMAFEFEFAEEMITGVRTGYKKNPADKLTKLVRDFEAGTFATFTSNHDQTRLLTQLAGNIDANKVVALILLTAPGAPFVYYGEEIGMVGDKPDEFLRTPMQWDDTPQTGGFTSGKPWQPLTEGYEESTVANQTNDPDSLLSTYRTLIHLRNDHSALRSGETIVAKTKGSRIYSVLRYDEKGAFLVVANVSGKPVSNYDISIPESGLSAITSVTLIYGEGDIAPLSVDDLGGFSGYMPKPELGAYETLIIRLDA